jgi:Fic-DOC domain mobile mystery protein B
MKLFAEGDGNTPLAPDEEADLIPNLATRDELNEWERLNILEAYSWALDRKRLRRLDPLKESYVRDLHRRMFDQTWKWAGRYRSTEKNLGIAPHLIRDALAGLLGDVQYWVGHGTYAPDEIAVRLHHRMVFIHPFANGNGRHARLMADVLALRLGSPVFTWGRAELVRAGNFRERYIEALRAADGNDIQLLLRFSRS